MNVNKSLFQSILSIMLVTALFSGSLTAFADSNEVPVETSIFDAVKEEVVDEVVEEFVEEISDKLKENLRFLERLEQEYGSSMSGFNQINQTLKDTKYKLREVHSESVSLKEQLFYLDQVIEVSTQKVIAINRQLTEKSNMIDILKDEMGNNSELQKQQEEFVADYLVFLYEQDQNYFNESDGELDAVGFLLADKGTASLENETEYFRLLNNTAAEIMDAIASSDVDMTEMQERIEEERVEIASLDEVLASEQSQLKAQKRAKSNLLAQTLGEESIYAELLANAKLEQKEARAELKNLSKNLSLIRAKIALLGEDFDPSAFEDLLDKSSKEVYEFYLSAANNESVSDMAWPVLPDPKKGISAYFREESYKRWAGIPHDAIDIPIAQNSAIRAPLNCVVYKKRDNGFGYNYVILACKGGYMLTFGHVTEFLVDEGDNILQGQAIALSGGTPGSKGAGGLTTGAHVHFEVMKDGKYRDPLDFLDLTLLPYDTLPEHYQARIHNKVKRRARLEGFIFD